MDYREIKILDSNHLLAFFASTEYSDSFTESYASSQPIDYIIPFSEYNKFIQQMVSLDLDDNILRTPLTTYKTYINKLVTPKELYQLYFRDIALAGMKELLNSYSRGLKCIRLFSSIDSSVSVPLTIVGLTTTQYIKYLNKYYADKVIEDIKCRLFQNFIIPSNLATTFDVNAKWNTSIINMYLAYYSVYCKNNGYIITTKEKEINL